MECSSTSTMRSMPVRSKLDDRVAHLDHDDEGDKKGERHGCAGRRTRGRGIEDDGEHRAHEGHGERDAVPHAEYVLLKACALGAGRCGRHLLPLECPLRKPGQYI